MEQKFITDNQGNKILPITHVNSVRDDNGNTIGSLMGAFEDEVRGLVDTPHENYVTVAATSQTTAAEDVLPDSGQSADTIYRVSNWDGSANSFAGAFDVTCYSEYAWDDVSNPNKYVFLAVKTQIGEVFDISTYNNNATYADLSAALGTNGANVPAEIRRGGMSVKFVHSVDNKYVQYRLMSDSFNTTISNWQGVKNEITAGSKDLVDSDGIDKKFAEFPKTIQNLMGGLDIVEITRGGKISTSGDNCTITNIETDSVRGYALIPCVAGDNFTLVTGTSGSAAAYRMYAWLGTPVENIAPILGKASHSYTPNNVTITAPANAAYLLINVRLDYPYLIYKGSGKDILTLSSNVVAYKSTLSNSSDMNTLETGFYGKTTSNVPQNWPEDIDSSGAYTILCLRRSADYTVQFYFRKDVTWLRIKHAGTWYLYNLTKNDYVNYNDTQNLTDEQKQKVWDNIGINNPVDLKTITGNEVLHNWVDESIYKIDVDPIDLDSPSSNVQMKCIKAACSANDQFTLNGIGLNSENDAVYIFTDSSGNILSHGTKTTYTEEIVKAPVNSAFMLVNFLNNNDAYYVLKGASVKVLANDAAVLIPEYYFEADPLDSKDYFTKKLDKISYIQEHISKNSDGFFFITDYHYHKNANNSPELMKYIRERTGIEKLFFGGDVGKYSTDPYKEAHSAGLYWDILQGCTPEFFSVLGNHEWSHDIDRPQDDPIQTGGYSEAGVMNFYIARHKRTSDGMDATSYGYYIDNTVNKVRYYFINERSDATPVDGSISWFGNSLLTVPEGYSVALVCHNAFINPSFSYVEYDGRWINPKSNSSVRIKRLSTLLNGLSTGTSVTISDVTYDFTGKSRTVVGIFCGHHHQGICYGKYDTFVQLQIDNSGDVIRDGNGNGLIEKENGVPVEVTNPEGISVFMGSCDTLISSYDINRGTAGNPWFWQEAPTVDTTGDAIVVNGTKIERQKGTITEQCFYVVQVDLDARKVYITAIGGDRDWEFGY